MLFRDAEPVSLVKLLILSTVALAMAGCGDDLVAAAVDGSAPGSTADAAPPDAALSDAGAACDEPAVVAVIGPEGGELTLCGARLVAAPGALAGPVELAIAAVDAPAPGPPRELAGPAFRFTADGGVELGGSALDIAVPHGGRAGRIELWAVEEGELFGVEACTVDDEVIGQLVGLLGTFVATADPYPYAGSPGDLGGGALSGQIGERDASFSFPDDGYVIDQSWGDSIALSAVTDILDGPDGPEQLRFDATIAGDQATLQYAQWYAGGVIWQLGTPERPGTTGVLDIARDGDRLAGTISATLFAGQDTIAFTADIDLTPAYWTFPPERFCGGGKKPPG
jgi:hypothetical protein